jgi:hypothetical protein
MMMPTFHVHCGGEHRKTTSRGSLFRLIIHPTATPSANDAYISSGRTSTSFMFAMQLLHVTILPVAALPIHLHLFVIVVVVIIINVTGTSGPRRPVHMNALPATALAIAAAQY